MGQFSWLFADTDNTRALCEGHSGYLVCPDNTALYEECYDGYGHFAGKDAYDLVAEWNRKYLSEHPEYMVPQAGLIRGDDGQYHDAPDKRVDTFEWYEAYADLSLTPDEVVERVKRKKMGIHPERYASINEVCYEYRFIGIDIACYDKQNMKIPYPIKICRDRPFRYDFIPASKGDPNQGWGKPDDVYT